MSSKKKGIVRRKDKNKNSYYINKRTGKRTKKSVWKSYRTKVRRENEEKKIFKDFFYEHTKKIAPFEYRFQDEEEEEEGIGYEEGEGEGYAAPNEEEEGENLISFSQMNSQEFYDRNMYQVYKGTRFNVKYGGESFDTYKEFWQYYVNKISDAERKKKAWVYVLFSGNIDYLGGIIYIENEEGA
jgi:hypothetical protein